MNNVSLIGRLTKDPELRYIQSTGNANVRFTLAVDKSLSKDKRMEYESQGRPTADFINCVAWGRRAEVIAQYVAKGDLFGVTGRIETSRSQGQDGHMNYYTDIIVNDFDFLQPKGTNDAGQQNQGFNQGGYQQGGYNRGQAPNSNQNNYQQNNQYQNQGNNQGSQQSFIGKGQQYQAGNFQAGNSQNNRRNNARQNMPNNNEEEVNDVLDRYGLGDDAMPSDEEDIPF